MISALGSTSNESWLREGRERVNEPEPGRAQCAARSVESPSNPSRPPDGERRFRSRARGTPASAVAGWHRAGPESASRAWTETRRAGRLTGGGLASGAKKAAAPRPCLALGRILQPGAGQRPIGRGPQENLGAGNRLDAHGAIRQMLYRLLGVGRIGQDDLRRGPATERRQLRGGNTSTLCQPDSASLART